MQIIKMEDHLQNINKNHQLYERKQFVNFKQLLKLKSMKNARKFDQERSLKVKNMLKDSLCHKNVQDRSSCQNCHFKLPVEEKSFQQISQRQSSKVSFGKRSRQVIFPLLKIQQEHQAGECLNVGIINSDKLPSRGVFLHRIRQISIEKLKDAVSNKNKRKCKYFRTRESQVSLPSKLNCRSISPLTNYGTNQEQKFPMMDEGQYEKFHCRISSSLEKASSRYQDIPLYQFIYDHSIGSSELIEPKLQSKMERVWRKKSRNAKEITTHT